MTHEDVTVLTYKNHVRAIRWRRSDVTGIIDVRVCCAGQDWKHCRPAMFGRVTSDYFAVLRGLEHAMIEIEEEGDGRC